MCSIWHNYAIYIIRQINKWVGHVEVVKIKLSKYTTHKSLIQSLPVEFTLIPSKIVTN
jgi:hypothetical protein